MYFLYSFYKVPPGNIVSFMVTDSDLCQAKISRDKPNNMQHIPKTTLYKSQSCDDIGFLPASLS